MVREAFGLRELNEAVDALDDAVTGPTQIELYQAVQESRRYGRASGS